MQNISDLICSSILSSKKEEEKINSKPKEKDGEFRDKVFRFTSDGNINSVDVAMKCIHHLLQAVLGDTVSFGCEYNSGKAKMPFISYSVINRERSDKTPLSDLKTNVSKEYVNGEFTGDVMNVTTVFYDCLIEFNFFTDNINEAIELKEKFETIIETYSGNLKKSGISNILFMKEVEPSHSTKYHLNPNATFVYYIELQKINAVRTSTLKTVSAEYDRIIKEENPELSKVLDELTSFNNII